MSICINLSIVEEQKTLLAGLQGEHLEEVLVTETGEGWTLLVVLKTAKQSLLVRNRTTSHPEYNDEYVQFDIAKCNEIDIRKHAITIFHENENENLTYRLKCGYKSLGAINDVRIVQDKVEWQNKVGVFRVEADVGIVIVLTGGSRLILWAVDSLAGFIRYTNDERAVDDINEQWKMKADRLTSSYRTFKSIVTKK